MLVIMRDHASRSEIDHVVELLEEAGAQAHLSGGEVKTIIGVIGDREIVYALDLQGLPGVEEVIRVLKPYKLVSRDFHPEDTVVRVGPHSIIGGGAVAVMAGPCSVESEEQMHTVAHACRSAGATMLRGGAYKPRSSPYAFQGLGVEGLRMLREAADSVGLPVVTEVLDVRDAETVAKWADVLQVGARNMQNFMMLDELGKMGKPVLLKRGLSATIEEVLSAAEYVLKGG
ncbi:MAG: 3-deoxy-7-phosphoheptulonate synthase, partial [Coriobacteriia bacterium]|nr:3-deoxy-7-phosphoheptulonate synthase [Coriobacteriia bacterium]